MNYFYFLIILFVFFCCFDNRNQAINAHCVVLIFVSGRSIFRSVLGEVNIANLLHIYNYKLRTNLRAPYKITQTIETNNKSCHFK